MFWSFATAQLHSSLETSAQKLRVDSSPCRRQRRQPGLQIFQGYFFWVPKKERTTFTAWNQLRWFPPKKMEGPMVRSDVFFPLKNLYKPKVWQTNIVLLCFWKKINQPLPKNCPYFFPGASQNHQKNPLEGLRNCWAANHNLIACNNWSWGALRIGVGGAWGKFRKVKDVFWVKKLGLLDVRNEQTLPATEQDLGGSRWTSRGI